MPMAAIERYCLLQFPAIESSFFVSYAVSIISSENGPSLSVPEINASLPLSRSLMIMFLGIPFPQDDFPCLSKTETISSGPNITFQYSVMQDSVHFYEKCSCGIFRNLFSFNILTDSSSS